ncbi:MAG: crotonase/enoyl-CoA hydratase family protein [Paracoccus sp. (in: a-proteobacteria)]|uniref:crotonase/enoyl-CoA hydratase family protein n=1 Tax=Paracoccus sp. TaxID=267 RepID=UPI0026DFCB1D|nr:crotonase/enoyl-CoA hydratase family protein [Paracoccus sp. (in: a-proteobacteria)]MDO5620333.1 crotonase/enoyl-CoA hydratase family protein [Paracoccus sp. (in: a-proteobacteria)]MDO5657757.1 crotonase/enoyl-CoA hydratase family protein [Paracoccus sp. (in: a-proteobacteria)]
MGSYTEGRIDGRIAELELIREDKRNAMSDGLMAEIEAFYASLPADVRVVILHGRGGHFCSGLDLSEHVSRSAEEGVYHSRNWHRVMDMIQSGGRITVSAMTGAVIGGGMELATATHVRIAEPSVIFQLPEGRRGIFVGGGAAARVTRILGADRMVEMMLTGRKYSADEGLRLGLCHYAVAEGEALPLARKLAATIAENAPMSNYFITQALPRIADMSHADGLFTESLAAALVQTTPDAAEGLNAFLEKRQPVFR